jgi:hypothetical protein
LMAFKLGRGDRPAFIGGPISADEAAEYVREYMFDDEIAPA